MSNTLVILGAGGHAKVCYEIALAMEKWSHFIVLDDNSQNDYFDVNGPISKYVEYSSKDFFVALGNNSDREVFYEKLERKNLSIATLVHPSAVISPTVDIGKGTVIMPGVIINSSSVIGTACILNTSCTVDHDNLIGNFTHISPGANLAGSVKVGKSCWLGINCTISNNVKITNNSIIGAGALVIKSIEDKGVYGGVPVRRIDR